MTRRTAILARFFLLQGNIMPSSSGSVSLRGFRGRWPASQAACEPAWHACFGRCFPSWYG